MRTLVLLLACILGLRGQGVRPIPGKFGFVTYPRPDSRTSRDPGSQYERYMVSAGPQSTRSNVGNRRAIVVLNNPPVNGVLEFIQQGSGSRLVLNGNVSGLTPGKHGFHIHEYGDVSQGCGSTKGHYNPFQVKHGAPDAEERHVGDLGNIIADQNGVAQVRIVDSVLSLYGDTSVIGRAIVVHAGEDDLGRGGDEGSMNTGNAGGRVACGIIGIAPPQ